MNIAKDVVKPIVVLVAITLIVSAALSITYRFTKVEETGPDINQINTIGRELMAQADEFEQMDNETKGAKYIFKAKNNAGILVQGEAKGYNNNVPIEFVVGFDPNGAITGLRILSQQETPGLGDQILKEGFALEFVGKTGMIELKTGSQNSIDGIAGATTSTKGVIAGINQARAVFDDVKGVLTK